MKAAAAKRVATTTLSHLLTVWIISPWSAHTFSSSLFHVQTKQHFHSEEREVSNFFLLNLSKQTSLIERRKRHFPLFIRSSPPLFFFLPSLPKNKPTLTGLGSEYHYSNLC